MDDVVICRLRGGRPGQIILGRQARRNERPRGPDSVRLRGSLHAHVVASNGGSVTHDPGWLVTAAQRHLQRAPALRLNALASTCGVSRHTLARALKGEAALSYRQLRRRCLRATADAMLDEAPPLSIKAVAFAMGFANPGSFARWLKQTTGDTPTIRRRTLRARADARAE